MEQGWVTECVNNSNLLWVLRTWKAPRKGSKVCKTYKRALRVNERFTTASIAAQCAPHDVRSSIHPNPEFVRRGKLGGTVRVNHMHPFANKDRHVNREYGIFGDDQFKYDFGGTVLFVTIDGEKLYDFPEFVPSKLASASVSKGGRRLALL